MPERIRINSKVLVTILREVSTDLSALEGGPVVFLRPYKLLVHFDNDIRQALAEMEEKRSKDTSKPTTNDSTKESAHLDATETSLQPPGQNVEKGDGSVPGASNPPVVGDNGDDELEVLRTLIEFMDEYITPVFTKYRTEATEATNIHFRDLWHLYRPGDEVVSWQDLDKKDSVGRHAEATAGDSNLLPSLPGKASPVIWKVLQVSRGRPVLGAEHGVDKLRAPKNIANAFQVIGYQIAYDGNTFGPFIHTFEIAHYDGTKKNSIRVWQSSCPGMNPSRTRSSPEVKTFCNTPNRRISFIWAQLCVIIQEETRVPWSRTLCLWKAM